MGRWGYCKCCTKQARNTTPAHSDLIITDRLLHAGLFEGDQDLDLVSDINYEFFQGDDKPATSESDSATKAPDSQPILEDGDYDVNKDLLFGDVSMIRAKLDTDGAGTALLARYRAKEGEYQGKYRVLLFGALMMRAGARLSNEDRQHMRDLVSQVNCNEGYMWPFTFWDDGFRGPGQRQFLVALERYQVGVPRDFQAAW